MVIRYIRWKTLPRWRSFIVSRRQALRLKERLRAHTKPPRVKVVELTPKDFQSDTEIVFSLPKYGRLIAVDLVLDIKITSGSSPSQGTDWHLRALKEIEISDAGKTYGRFHPRLMRYLTAQFYDYDIKSITAGAGESTEEKDLIRMEFDWTIREDSFLEQFPNEGQFGINLLDKADPALIIRTTSADVTDTTIDKFKLRPVLYISMVKSPVKPELWADYKILSFTASSTYELDLQDNVYHLASVLLQEDTSYAISAPSKIELVDTEKDFTFFSLSNSVLTELVRIWNEQDTVYNVFPFHIGYFRNVLVTKKRELLFKVTTSVSAGQIILQQIGYKK